MTDSPKNRVRDPALENVRRELHDDGHLNRLLSRMDRSRLDDNSAKEWRKK